MILEERRCEWCGDELMPWVLANARFCSQRCRQARQRFRVGGAPPGEGRAMRFGYYDPPYPGLAQRYYGDEEVDHAQLVDEALDTYPDGWALSTSSKSMQDVLGLIPGSVKPLVGIWYKGARSGVAHQARDAYEPLIVVGGRATRLEIGDQLDNVLHWGGRQLSHPDALVGMKPAAFCEWMFRLLGARRGDELVDVFPGSGAVARAWSLFQSENSDARKPSRLAGAMGVDVDARRR